MYFTFQRFFPDMTIYLEKKTLNLLQMYLETKNIVCSQ